jgi:glycosyltransferase XagB
LIVLCRNPRRLLSELGLARCAAISLVLISFALAPLVGPLYALGLAANIARGGFGSPSDMIEIGSMTLWTSVFVAGIPAILWPTLLGMKRRALLNIWPSLFLFPVYCLLVCHAGWVGLCDLIKRPHYWHKIEHGLARTSRRLHGLPRSSAGTNSALQLWAGH